MLLILRHFICNSYVARYGTKTHSERAVTPICNCYSVTLSPFNIQDCYASTYASRVQGGTILHCYNDTLVHILV